MVNENFVGKYSVSSEYWEKLSLSLWVVLDQCVGFLCDDANQPFFETIYGISHN